jgi:predicted transglutaminase-like protease
MIAQIALSTSLSTLGLLGASRFMNVGLRFLHALIISLSTGLIAIFLFNKETPISLVNISASLIIYIFILKIFTGESVWTVIKLSILATIIEYIILLGLVKTGALILLYALF